ncbi:MAG TPA: hypothetical protein ENJ09_08750, partial [Planctomycetes bacterium]|nr:hypothetical protein [Planctomycetota bacterium]
LLSPPSASQGRLPVPSTPRRTTGATAQRAYIKASNTNADDAFGTPLAVCGDLAVVGAPLEDSDAVGVAGNETNNDATDSGAAYVFTRDPSTGCWTQEAYLKSSNSEAGDLFGISVALTEDTIAIGAVGESSTATGVQGDESNNGAVRAGAVYVFVRDAQNGAWTQQAYLKASNTDAEDAFGSAVAIVGDTLVVGAKGESSSATGVNGVEGDNGSIFSGAAYVFTRQPQTGAWSQQAYLKASNTDARDFFGGALAMSGEMVVIGATRESSGATGVNGDQGDNSAPLSGAAYVFRRTGASWSQEAYLKASNTDANDVFGESVAISRETIVIGAPREASAAGGVNGDQADNSLTMSGAAYVFTRNPATGLWNQEAYLKASNPDAFDQFGQAAVSGDHIVIGALAESSQATGIDGDQLDNSRLSAGAAYAFARVPGAGCWNQRNYIKASNTRASSLFGKSLSLSGTTLWIGSPGESSNATGINGNQGSTQAFGSGAAYVFHLDPSLPGSEVVRLGTPPNPNALLPGRTSGPVVGTTWDPAIDHTGFFPGASLDLLLVSPLGPQNLPSPRGTLLCSLTPPRMVFSSPPGIAFSLPIPADCSLIGVPACAQGASIGGGRVQLTNALDLVLGAP